MIDLVKLKYFQMVVESDFNLTRAAHGLYISQPALGKAMKVMEEEENILFFVRDKNRIIGLTTAGEKLYEESKKLYSQYNSMIDKTRTLHNSFTDDFRISGPPLLLTTYLSNLVSELNYHFPKVRFIFTEGNRQSILENLLNHQIDFALMTYPSHYSKYGIEETLLHQTKFSAYLSVAHPYATKEILTWEDISSSLLSVPGREYSTHHLIVNKMESLGLNPIQMFTGGPWDFQVSLLKKNDHTIAIMPKFLEKYFTDAMKKEIVSIPIMDSIPWLAYFCDNPTKNKSPIHRDIKFWLISRIQQSYNSI